MNKNGLIEALREAGGISKSEARKTVELFFDSMADALAKGGRVEIRGLCSFFVKEYKGYTGRNPKSGKPVTVKAKRLPFFKSGLDLKTRVDR
ncbi:integration host factor subunit beta [Desulfosarcina ovata subsp. sediminis]|uniref:Integration host factor subunit beta n=1 Tax=Desulfosarcina ovata subsp. sediminis TaxID=885957 RepID=A0A5K7ZKC9_9BACT|nr:HU family DNA-binding protein [Desulfosarcina ovata]BBO80437.1 integration host factor subunit beta [Desulfosarcina ovata subsp. sediminis]